MDPSDIFKNALPPLPKPTPPQVDLNEYQALVAIVVALVGLHADEWQRSKRGTANTYINLIAEIAQRGITGSSILGGTDVDNERMRSAVLEKINHILGGIRFPSDGDIVN